jgi:hypothetical protein
MLAAACSCYALDQALYTRLLEPPRPRREVALEA